MKYFFIVSLCFQKEGFYPYILVDGYKAYRKMVEEFLENRLFCYDGRVIVVTGPQTAGKNQFVKNLNLLDEQVLNLEELCKQFSYSQTFFETQLFNAFTSFSQSKSLWVIYEFDLCKDLCLPRQLEMMMGQAVRVHLEEELESRIRFILQVHWTVDVSYLLLMSGF